MSEDAFKILQFKKYLTDKPKICSKCHTKSSFVFLPTVKCIGPYQHSDHKGVECSNCGEVFSIDKPCLGFGDVWDLIKKDENMHLIQNIISQEYLEKYKKFFSFQN